jgi:hypothetical protein
MHQITPFSPAVQTTCDAPHPVRCELNGTGTAVATGITVKSTTPVLTLCRRALAAGLDPNLPMEVFRGDTLALRIRSIGEAAGLEIRGDGVGFRPAAGLGTAPPVRPNGKSGLGDTS